MDQEVVLIFIPETLEPNRFYQNTCPRLRKIVGGRKTCIMTGVPEPSQKTGLYIQTALGIQSEPETFLGLGESLGYPEIKKVIQRIQTGISSGIKVFFLICNPVVTEITPFFQALLFGKGRWQDAIDELSPGEAYVVYSTEDKEIERISPPSKKDHPFE